MGYYRYKQLTCTATNTNARLNIIFLMRIKCPILQFDFFHTGHCERCSPFCATRDWPQTSFHSTGFPINAPYFQLLVRFLFPTRECDTVDYIFRKMGLKYRTYLEGRKVYGCQNCRSHLANSDGLISKVNVLGSLASIKISTNTRLLTAIPRSTWPSLFISICRECIRRPRKGKTNDYRKAHYRYCILLPMRHGSWLAICK
jgi:hypothetical protein